LRTLFQNEAFIDTSGEFESLFLAWADLGTTS